MSNLNANLLVSLDALLQEGNVRVAARRMGVTQSAMSHTLRQLRVLLDDPLLIRVGNRMEPTRRAAIMAGPLHLALTDLADAVALTEHFSSLQTERCFKVAAADDISRAILPRLMSRMAAEAPLASIDVVPIPKDPFAAIQDEGLDLCVVPPMPLPSWLASATLLPSGWSVLARAGHPDLADGLDLDLYCSLRHVMFRVADQVGPSLIDQALAELGRTRRVVLRMAYSLAMPAVLAATDHLATVPEIWARELVRVYPLAIHPPPIPLPYGPVTAVWHRRCDHHPAHAWFRELLLTVADQPVA